MRHVAINSSITPPEEATYIWWLQGRSNAVSITPPRGGDVSGHLSSLLFGFNPRLHEEATFGVVWFIGMSFNPRLHEEATLYSDAAAALHVSIHASTRRRRLHKCALRLMVSIHASTRATYMVVTRRIKRGFNHASTGRRRLRQQLICRAIVSITPPRGGD